ncbi:bifunctional biotin--[acetyl-CoA-carboxylase] ligase/biotin operon repressor BirA [Pseudidiomarina tainanensis]|jgi:BirA family biotin operon repressor/biotin-[acetyl-CoA-carboxylase] ligase|uniref:Bifunctional ligase/repressor BirA n=2 Tax=Pseudidiomarina TaxID=2800384 RepID=A0A1I6G1D0_9GAMM|nr:MULTISPECIES: bifunctional biotin--[acetyl-CoA-carboxylase] ligase/biotin operon repressor BirA [Pseudidiomarina]RZQ57303.1 bifunctional biotin--[acetyl-CoA-carboxylase] ligase/biotin operon repressor BirA [Pseudidiomarina tainanensis]SFR35986.1 BirA family transcriptional regulator, biotin operon repressor / biotin-[acetyl-CoA-carboxylase] ligase [Pseudidiomarina maritima]
MKPQRVERITQIIEILSDGQFHSGEKLGAQLDVSRTAISQYIKDVQALGIDVFRVTGKGYKFANELKLLHLNVISDFLNSNQENAQDIHLERVVGSTNDFIKHAITHNIDSGYAVFSEAQTAGRGRRGKRWVSPFGSNLYMSMYWRLEDGMGAAMGLSLALGTVIAELLSELGVYDVEVKWPNDVIVNGKKLAGILIELEGQALGVAHVIIGIGVNIKMPSWLADQIDQPWTDLSTLLNNNFDRNHIAAMLLAKCRQALRVYEQEGLKPFISRWQRFDRLAMKPVRIIMGDKELHGIAEGIDESGALLVKRDGKLERFHAGEVSLRYGA